MKTKFSFKGAILFLALAFFMPGCDGCIKDKNNDPKIRISCPDIVDEDTGGQCDILRATDPDISPSKLKCFINPATTCTGVTVPNCFGPITIPPQGEAAGGGGGHMCNIYYS